MKTIKFFTLGCKVNQYDTQNMRERFVRAGFKEIDNGEKADFCIINTCTVTATADRKSRYLIQYAHRKNPQARIVVTGCYAQLDSREIMRIAGVTDVIKNDDKDRIFELLRMPCARRELAKQRKINITGFDSHTRAFLKIQDGCTNFCSFCKVPLVRGKPTSKPLDKIIGEAGGLVRNGFKEIVLCGICLGAYGKDLHPNITLTEVISKLERIPPLLKVRLSSIEPRDISDALIDKIACSKKLCRHLHIPLQSGNDEILKKMNRNYCRRDYLDLITKIKMRIPEIAITTDALVGFPGESDAHFKSTLDLIKEISPLKVHVFPYSPRKETPAYNFKDHISLDKIKIRIEQLRKAALSCSRKYKIQFSGRIMDALVEERLAKNPDFWVGLTDNYLKVLIKSNLNLKNKLISVQINKIKQDYCIADTQF